jgi:bifunctional ADP-heptose synthase (sugar kinase/adenylyltransferase)
LGDTIIDQYSYVTPLGQTGKGNVFSVNYKFEEQFAGGSIAVANHIAQFVDQVTLVTGLGAGHEHEEFILQKLSSNIEPHFHYFENASTVTKKRFVDSELSKFFEVYFYCEDSKVANIDELYKWLVKNLSAFDVVVVPDFGNGFITNRMTEILSKQSKYLCVNTQINSGNRGYHVINRYQSADFISLNEPELRLAAHNRHDSLEYLAKKISFNVGAKELAVTLGTSGVMLYNSSSNSYTKVPALSSKVVDRVGAGDAFLSMASLCSVSGFEPNITAFLGSIAAALDVQIVCNREPINPIDFYKYITTLLK